MNNGKIYATVITYGMDFCANAQTHTLIAFLPSIARVSFDLDFWSQYICAVALKRQTLARPFIRPKKKYCQPIRL